MENWGPLLAFGQVMVILLLGLLLKGVMNITGRISSLETWREDHKLSHQHIREDIKNLVEDAAAIRRSSE